MTTRNRRTTSNRRRRQALGALLLAGGLIGATLGLSPSAQALDRTATPQQSGPASPDPRSSAPAPVRPKLRQQLDAKGEATFWVRFDARADLEAASQIADRDARGEAVYDALKTTATKSQKQTVARLERAGVEFETFYATNAIRVIHGSDSLAEQLAAQPEVEALYPTRDYTFEEPTEGRDLDEVSSVEWGVAAINADDVWSRYDDTGRGITVANIDTGVQYDHPALVRSYRGNNGDGTFSHDYNWFDAAKSCPTAAPCDTNGHGTHTMGTMVGDDEAGNQVGVAPGVRWITANGCCPSDAALLSASQWMLAPTRVDGSDPDPSKRPDIINNSWGSNLPSNDPFLEDLQLAWEASGIFSAVSNGNMGPQCNTSGSPGSRAINYSVGAFDATGAIAPFSSRGTGQDGAIKPDIAAPGVNVRSSIPGSLYGSYNGTSMAAPHLAGAVALLWSAAPALLGDVEATRDLLDQTAVDTDDLRCGGTIENNNIFGEGKLDALALLDAAPVGDVGTLSGTVTDAETGKPLSGAAITLTGPFERTVTTDADGNYSVLALGGDYDVRASLFGYDAETVDASVAVDQTLRQDFALQRSPSVTLSGTVTDGSGHGWPLHAKVKIDGPAGSYFTEPATGHYSITLPSNAIYTVTVSSEYPGYEKQTSEVALSGADVVHDVALPVDSSTCTAAGYRFDVDGWTEDFDAGTRPEGWTVTDPLANGKVWRFDNPRNRENLTGGAGEFAIMDSSYYGNSYQDSALVSPVFDLSGMDAPVVGFKQDLNVSDDIADVDVSIDGGATWQNVLQQRIHDRRGPREEILELPMAAGESQVQVRFHHHNARYDWWWQVDDFFVGERTCDPIAGGLVVGEVSDANTDKGLTGATVRSLDVDGLSATTEASAPDRGVREGFYWMFTERTGEHVFEAATGSEYGTSKESVSVTPDDATEVDFELAAGRLRLTPEDLSLEMKIGKDSKKRKVTITNEGGRPATVELSERNGTFVMQGETEPRGAASQIARSGAPLKELDVPVALTPNPAVTSAEPQAHVAPHEAPWTGITDLTEEAVDNRAVTIDGLVYSLTDSGSGTPVHLDVHDPQTDSWTPAADLPASSSSGAVGAVDGRLVVVGGWTGSGIGRSTWIYDPATDAWTRGADAPAARSASGFAVIDDLLYVVGGCTTMRCFPMSSDVTAYDIATDTWREVADYPEPLAYVGCGGIDGAVYCTGGSAGGMGSPGTTHSYSYDPEQDAWASLPDAPLDTWGSQVAAASGLLVVNGGVQRGVITNRTIGYDPAVSAWSALPNSNTARYRGAAACGFYKLGGARAATYGQVDAERLPGLDDCGATDVEWMSVDTETITLEPGESVRVAVTMDPDVEQPGRYTAGIRVQENTPYAIDPLEVTMTVTAPD